MPKSGRALRALLSLLPALALLLALGAAAPAANAASARARVVSSGWNDYSCKPSAAHPRPVVLAHGTAGNSVDNWLLLAPYLVNRGYCVFSLDYGQLPGVPFFHGLNSVERSSHQLSDFVDKVRSATGTGKVDLVGHSQGGGLMPRYYLNFLGGAAKVNSLVGIAPSNHGTSLSGLVNLMDLLGARQAVHDLAPGLTDQAFGSPFLKKLNSVPDTVPGVRYTTIVTRYDEIVTPYRQQFLSGPNVRNIVLQDLCAIDLSEHVTIGTTDRIVAHEVANALDPGHATPTNCLSAVS
ncbi:alpha/beta fold hydrolase [Streptomyces orinoci]|uniref:Alpha/beta fold hydrolase n=1 Tax=Streptomyces orinoci TaxID=67339 RepID=A0ABV3K4G2_STRON|nr:alpha/beta fold hydrolase [Streptomyces orinoci]